MKIVFVVVFLTLFSFKSNGQNVASEMITSVRQKIYDTDIKLNHYMVQKYIEIFEMERRIPSVSGIINSVAANNREIPKINSINKISD